MSFSDTLLSFTLLNSVKKVRGRPLKTGKTLYTEVGNIESMSHFNLPMALVVYFMQRKMNRNSSKTFHKRLILYAQKSYVGVREEEEDPNGLLSSKFPYSGVHVAT